MGVTSFKNQGSLTPKKVLKLINDHKKKLGSFSRNMKFYLKTEPISLESVRRLLSTINRMEQRLSFLEEESIHDLLEIWINQEKNKLELAESNLRSSFAENLYNLLRENGYKLEGHLPKLKVGFYHLDIDFKRNQCRIYYGQDKEPVVNLKIDPVEISNFITNHKQKLNESFGDPDSFVSNLERAYMSVLKKSDDRIEEKPSIVDVMLELALLKQRESFHNDPLQKYFKNYGRIQFSYDLYRLLKNTPQDIRVKLSTATRAQARNRGSYLWVPKNELGDGSIYSCIEIVGGRNVRKN